jgi:hypothetical protein
MSTEPVVAESVEHEVVIRVNAKPVKVMGPRVTGLEIKQAAVDQGVPIRLDFLLYQELPGGNKQVLDDQVVRVHRDSRFLAIANDDNS